MKNEKKTITFLDKEYYSAGGDVQKEIWICQSTDLSMILELSRERDICFECGQEINPLIDSPREWACRLAFEDQPIETIYGESLEDLEQAVKEYLQDMLVTVATDLGYEVQG